MQTQKIKVEIEAEVPVACICFCDKCDFLEQLEWDNFYCTLFHKELIPLVPIKIDDFDWKNICRLTACLDACANGTERALKELAE